VNVSTLLEERAVERPDASAIVEGLGSVSITFRTLNSASASVARQLAGHGISAGDGVLVLVPMSVDLYVVFTALLRLGAVAIFPDPSSGIEQIDRCCRIHPPRGFIGTAKAHVLRLLSRSVRRIPRKFSMGTRVPGAVGLRTSTEEDAPPPAACTAETPALLTFTSGSTGTPKAALRSHGFLLAQQRALSETLELSSGDIDLATLPIFVLANLAEGVTTIIPATNLRRPDAMEPGPVLAQIERFHPNRASGSPAFFERLAEGARRRGCSLDSFHRIYTGGAPVFPGMLDRIAGVAPRARVIAVYGSTEAEPIAHLDRSEISLADRESMIRGSGLLAGSVTSRLRLAILPDRWGQPVAPMTPAEFEAECLPAERPGEIVVSGAHVLDRYLYGAGDEETKFSVGNEIWHRTGDAGWLDARRRLWLLGRCAARVGDARGEFYPFSVECAAVEILGVRRAAALAVHGRRVLVLEARNDDERPDLALLSGPLGWVALDDVRFLPRIPVDRRHNSKVDYGALARLMGTSP
jgi:acyl-CoA synthetase (AMP-forming)/AMP-acid ligase II